MRHPFTHTPSSRTNGRPDGRTERMDKWMDRQMDGRINGWMDGQSILLSGETATKTMRRRILTQRKRHFQCQRQTEKRNPVKL